MKIGIASYYKEMQIGDIVCDSEYGPCMVILDEDDTYKYKLLNIADGRIENGYMTLDAALKNCYLLISNKDLVLNSEEESK